MDTHSESLQDHDCLNRFVERRDEEAFQCLVSRYVGLLRATALRRCGDCDIAEEAVQNAFTALVRKANTLSKHPTLGGWLHKTVSQEAAHLGRAQRIRSKKMKHYQAHQDTALANLADSRSVAGELIDQALGKLPSKDRDILLLRFFEDLSFREIGQRLGKSEDASQKHAERSLKRLGEIVHRLDASIPAVTGTVLASHFLLTSEGAATIEEITHKALAASSGTAVASLSAFFTMVWVKPLAGGAIALLVTLPVVAEWQERRELRDTLQALQERKASRENNAIAQQRSSILVPLDRGVTKLPEDQEALEAAEIVGKLKRDEQAFRAKYATGIPPATAEDYPGYLTDVDAFFQKSIKVMTDPRVTAVIEKGKSPATHARMLVTAMDLPLHKAKAVETLICSARTAGKKEGLLGHILDLSKSLQIRRKQVTGETSTNLSTVLSEAEMAQWHEMFGPDYLLGDLSFSPTPVQGMPKRKSNPAGEGTQP